MDTLQFHHGLHVSVRNLYGEGLYWRNLYWASYELMEKLYTSNIFTTGTVHINRKDLPQLACGTTAMNKEEFEWRTCSMERHKECSVTIKPAFKPCTERSVQRTQKDGKAAPVNCPEAFIEYTKRMDGVDRLHERHGCYSVSRRSRRWWLSIFYFLVDCCVVDAHILYNSVHPGETITMLEFRQQVFGGLVADCTSRCRRSNIGGCAWICRRSIHAAKPCKPTGIPEDVRIELGGGEV